MLEIIQALYYDIKLSFTFEFSFSNLKFKKDLPKLLEIRITDKLLPHHLALMQLSLT